MGFYRVYIEFVGSLGFGLRVYVAGRVFCGTAEVHFPFGFWA